MYVFQLVVGSGVGDIVELGQGENSQFGPVLPTLVPSGQIFASIVQAVDPPSSCILIYQLSIKNEPTTTEMIKTTVAIKTGSLDLGLVGVVAGICSVGKLSTGGVFGPSAGG